jgi:prophage regulatory protein
MADKFLRSDEVTAVTGVPKSTRYDLINRELFPKPIKLSERMVAWSANEIADWMQQKIAKRDQLETA